MNASRLAIYPGSFDPITNGHLDIVGRAVTLFDEVCIAVITNPTKHPPIFTVEERMEMIARASHDIPRATVDHFDGLLVNFVKKKKASAVIRGLRAVSDFEAEFQMALTNRRLLKNFETVFLMTDYKYSYLSSSIVRQLAQYGGDIEGLVPDGVLGKLRNKYSAGQPGGAF